MALALNQVVEVRVAVVRSSAGDLSVGQVYDDGDWGDLVWINLAGSSARPLEFGNVHFVGEVYDLAVDRGGTVRPGVNLRAWRSGVGTPVDSYILTSSGHATLNDATLLSGGSPVITDLPGLGAVENTVPIRGFQDQRVGWTGHFPNPPSWFGNQSIRKRVQRGTSPENNLLGGLFGGANTLAGFDAWLSTNQPEYASPFTLGPWVISARPQTSNNVRHITHFLVSMHLSLSSPHRWGWTARRSTLAVRAGSGDFQAPCTIGGAPLSFTQMAWPFTPAATATLLRNPVTATAWQSGVLETPDAGGGTVSFWSGDNVGGAEITLTVNAQGRVTGIEMTPTVATIFGYQVLDHGLWGLCRPEGGAFLPW